jgi:hypothetical protein
MPHDGIETNSCISLNRCLLRLCLSYERTCLVAERRVRCVLCWFLLRVPFRFLAGVVLELRRFESIRRMSVVVYTTIYVCVYVCMYVSTYVCMYEYVRIFVVVSVLQRLNL